jgi:ATP-dependent exoDNAse (exonuclease V) alpha subunit
MTILHLRLSVYARSKGENAIDVAARYAAEALQDQSNGFVYDYRHERGVVFQKILGPDWIAPWWDTRAALWNAAERNETRSDSRVAREYQIALPHELSSRQRIELAEQWARYVVERYGNVVDLTVHVPPVEGDSRNHFAKLLSTTRQVTATGFGEKTEIERAGLGAGRREYKALHAQWAELVTQTLRTMPAA